MYAVQTSTTEASHTRTQFEKFCFLFQKLCEQCCTVALIEIHSTYTKEKNLLLHTLSTIVSQAKTTVALGKLNFHTYTPPINNRLNSKNQTETLFSNIKFYSEKLWQLLKYPSTPPIRSLLIDFIQTLEEFAQTFVLQYLQSPGSTSQPAYLHPKNPTQPSIRSQVINTTITIDPYLQSLSRNYYYPLYPVDMDPDQEMTLTPSPNQLTQQPATPEPKRIITVKDSIEAIDDLLNELNVTMQPSLPQPDSPILSPSAILQITQNSNMSINKIRFSLHRKNTASNLKEKVSSLPLLKSFFKTIVSANTQTKILPIRNDSNVHHIKTFDQILDLSLIGAKHYIRTMKSSLVILNGDYQISSPLAFDDFKSHPKRASWLDLNGYNIIYSECQASDMVLIGLISRVSPITWRDDLKREIMSMEEWSNNPFYFRLYPSTLSSNLKGAMTPVLLIDVDRPNIDLGMNFFRTLFDGENKISSCGAAYTFFSLYKNKLTDDDRIKIINDNELHVGHMCYIHMQGIKDIDAIVSLKQNVPVKLRTLILSLHSSESTNGRIFRQIEHQSDPEWLTCAFDTTDAGHVASKLHTIAPALCNYITKADHAKVFPSPDKSLNFVTKSIAIKRGKMQIASKPICSVTQAHTDKMLSKLRALPDK